MTLIWLGVLFVFGGVLQMAYQPIWKGRLSGGRRLRRLLDPHKSIGQLAHCTPNILQPEVTRALENELTYISVRCSRSHGMFADACQISSV